MNIIGNGPYCVYAHINRVNGKMYIGQTIHGDKPNKRWRYGLGYVTQKYFYRAIQKYGWDGFDHEIIASHLTKEEAVNFEILLIRELKTYDKQFGYNVTFGGEGSCGLRHTEESKEKQRKSMLKHCEDSAYIQRMRDVVPKRPIHQFTLNGTFIKCYESVKEVERQTGIHNGSVSKCALGKISSTEGYIFLFEEDIDKIQQRVERYILSRKMKRENIVQLSLDGTYIKQWKGATEAGRVLNIQYKNINAVCRGKRKKAGGYKWMYLSDYKQLNKD